MRTKILGTAILLVLFAGYKCETCGEVDDIERSVADITVENLFFELSANNNVDDFTDIDPEIFVRIEAAGDEYDAGSYERTDTDTGNIDFRKDFKGIEFLNSSFEVFVSVNDVDDGPLGDDPVCRDSRVLSFVHGVDKQWTNLGFCQGAVSLKEISVYNSLERDIDQRCTEDLVFD